MFLGQFFACATVEEEKGNAVRGNCTIRLGLWVMVGDMKSGGQYHLMLYIAWEVQYHVQLIGLYTCIRFT